MWPLIRVVFHLQPPEYSNYPEPLRTAPLRGRTAVRNVTTFTTFTTHQGSSGESIMRVSEGQLHSPTDANELSWVTLEDRGYRPALNADVESNQRQQRLEDITVRRTMEVTYQ